MKKAPCLTAYQATDKELHVHQSERHSWTYCIRSTFKEEITAETVNVSIIKLVITSAMFCSTGSTNGQASREGRLPVHCRRQSSPVSSFLFHTDIPSGGQTAIEIAIKSSARRPKFQTPTQAAGARASRTANMILSVVTLDRACGEDDTCNNPFICKIPLFLLSLCQKHFTHRADFLRQRTSCRADKGTTATFTALHSAVFQELLFLSRAPQKRKGGPEESDPDRRKRSVRS